MSSINILWVKSVFAILLWICAATQITAHAQVRAASSSPAASPAYAPASASGTWPQVSGSTMDKKPFQLAALKGKVVLLMFWSTDCPVCRDQMPELRENVQGWATKPFELVLISVDKSMQDVDSYNAILNKSVPLKLRFTQLWTGDAGFTDNLGTTKLTRAQLPVTYLIDKAGKLVAQHHGRIPAPWWDTIADLL